MMTAEEGRRRVLRNLILISLFFCLMILGIVGTVYYFQQLQKTTAALRKVEAGLIIVNDSLRATTLDLNLANAALEKARDTLSKRKQEVDRLIELADSSNSISVLKPYVESLTVSRDSARSYARMGYSKLKAKDFKGAMEAFRSSEKAYNGYRDSYEVYFLLWSNRTKLEELSVRKQILKTVIEKYNSLRILNSGDLQSL